MGMPQGDDIVQVTNPYYRTAYALVFKPGRGLDGVDTLIDQRLKDKRIGVVAGTPPATNMVLDGLIGKAKSYPLVIDTRYNSSAVAMINDIVDDTIDAGVLWGPLAGYYAKQSKEPLAVVLLLKETNGSRMAYRIGMGVRYSDQNWKRQLNQLIQAKQSAITEILLSYGIPLIDEDNHLVEPSFERQIARGHWSAGGPSTQCRPDILCNDRVTLNCSLFTQADNLHSLVRGEVSSDCRAGNISLPVHEARDRV